MTVVVVHNVTWTIVVAAISTHDYQQSWLSRSLLNSNNFCVYQDYKNQVISYWVIAISILAVCMAAILQICKLSPMGHFVTDNNPLIKCTREAEQNNYVI